MTSTVFALDADARDTRGPPHVGALIAIGTACVALAAFIAVLGARNDVEHIQIALLEWISVPYIGAGLVAWSRRPDSRLGLLMIAGGFASGLSAFQFSHHPHLSTVGAFFDVFVAAIFLHVYLAFPDGRLHSRVERVLVAVAYAAAVGLQAGRIGLGDFGSDKPLVLLNRPDIAEDVSKVQLLSISAICLVAVGVLVQRRRRTAARRRSLAALVDAFLLGLVMLALLFVMGSFELFTSIFKPVQRATLSVVGIAPIAFLVGLVDARLARSAVGDLIINLQRHPTPADLQAELARALRDPSLLVVYWLPEYQTYAGWTGVR
jgi:hypothetical protein